MNGNSRSQAIIVRDANVDNSFLAAIAGLQFFACSGIGLLSSLAIPAFCPSRETT
jgi:hypothetical protein